MTSLFDDIAAFCMAHQMSERRLGEMALNDKNFIGDLRDGRNAGMKTVERLKRFMAAYPNHERDAA